MTIWEVVYLSIRKGFLYWRNRIIKTWPLEHMFWCYFHFAICALQGFVTPETEYDYVDDVFFDNPPVSPPGSPPYTPSSTFFDAPSSLHPIAERSKLSEGNNLFYYGVQDAVSSGSYACKLMMLSSSVPFLPILFIY